MILRGQVDFLARSQSLSLRYRAASSLYTREPLLYHPQISVYPVRARLAAKTMAASQQSWPTRAVQCPTGALIAARPRNDEHRPLQNGGIWPRRGQTVGRRKSVKKNAALLRFLAFLLLDLLFGVPRGRAPWAVPRASEVAGLFCFSFGHKREGTAGSIPLKKGVAARWQRPIKRNYHKVN